MPLPDRAEPVIVHLNIPFTRRKDFHAIAHPDGTPIYRSPSISDILKALDDLELHHVVFSTGDRAWTAELRKTETLSEPEQWPRQPPLS